ncbi:5-oxoprolinase subunit PxpB [Staphylococcus sp. ACRSN]|uniref:5-oxoprolinase subunit PxpB n=1 Tax=Staphylococcus sp. ACRSN TaxID=2918214 RepID=UPI001EF39CB4|nr:5-oxoprolinase subunit PxpB [Staphylococcus sp. ACRSN]MCG7338559.1 5-oxoprolinase subunit PxpB [Staphylococcus sp. ACRSN]
MEFKFINEQTIMIYFENQIDSKTFAKVQHVSQYIREKQCEAITEIIPSYRAIMLYVDTYISTLNEVLNDLCLENLDLSSIDESQLKHKTIHLPVLYGGEYGQDIEEVAAYNDLTTDDVVKIHSSNKYLIYMLGFMPGFPFLGGLDAKLHTPRRKEPRTKIEAGSVGIANNQTGLYPKQSPGGWQIIGRTPINVFDINREPMCLYEAGDAIQFYSIDLETYNQIEKQQTQNDFNIEKWVKFDYEH